MFNIYNPIHLQSDVNKEFAALYCRSCEIMVIGLNIITLDLKFLQICKLLK